MLVSLLVLVRIRRHEFNVPDVSSVRRGLQHREGRDSCWSLQLRDGCWSLAAAAEALEGHFPAVAFMQSLDRVARMGSTCAGTLGNALDGFKQLHHLVVMPVLCHEVLVAQFSDAVATCSCTRDLLFQQECKTRTGGRAPCRISTLSRAHAFHLFDLCA
jgi:hypothetical protein